MNDRVEPFLLAAPSGLDPSFCEREPIHVPGAIQPHGAVIAALADGWLVTHASANLVDVLGRPAEAVLGRPLRDALGDAVFQVLRDAGSRDRTVLSLVQALPGTDGRALHLSAHRSGARICVDIEPVFPEPGHRPPMTIVHSVLDTFRQATSQKELCELAIRGLRSITGYDRVMVYRFGEGGHGEVIAEVHAPQLEPYLGNHYPTTDIPPQARRQYLRQRVGAVADSRYRPVPLLADAALDDGVPLDLTYSALRSVSPVHREFMRNMGTAASLSIGLARGQELWGLLICHHATPRIVDPEMRAVVDMIGQVASLLLGTLGEAEVYTQRLDRDASLRTLVNRLSAPVPLPEALAAAEAELLDLVHATGVVVRISDSLFRLGRTPPWTVVQRVLAVLQPVAGDEPLAVDDLGLRHPEFAACTGEASGALLLPLAPGIDDVILWFRPESSRTVTWAGNPAEHAVFDPATGQVSPRTSFAAWKQTTTGCSTPWTEADLALAQNFRSAVEVEVAQRAKAELAWLRHYQELSDSLERKVEQRGQALETETRERQKAEATLQQAQKMEAIGQLTGGVAHDFNNVLAAVLGNLDLAQARSTDPATRRFLQNAQHAAERGAKLTDHLLSFARKQPLRREPCELNRLSLRFKDLIARAIGPAIEVSMTLADDLWTVMADANQFEMALLNMAVNARDAMPEGGRLVIATSNVPAGSPELPSDLDPGDYARVSMQDTGTGMSAEVAGRAFEPFYTTKQVGKGTGLGLSQIYGFSKQLGGTAMLSSEVGSGTRIDLLLPRAPRPPGVALPAAARLAPADEPPAGRPPNGARLLVIDDEPDVRAVTADTLRELGFHVVSAESARQGLEILERGAAMDLVVTDFSMPEMNGIEFIRRAQLLRPDLPCLLVTGYADIRDPADMATGDVVILRKPYRMKQLAAIVGQLLERTELLERTGRQAAGDAPAPPAPIFHPTSRVS